MVLVQGLPGWVLLGLCLGCASWSDLGQRRIPNALVLSGWILACAVHLWELQAGRLPLAGATLWAPLAGGAVGALMLLPMYLCSGMAAGDVKLMSMVGAFLGPSTALWAALFAMVAGGVLALLWWTAARWLRRDHAQGLPYAPAIAVGAVAASMRSVLV